MIDLRTNWEEYFLGLPVATHKVIILSPETLQEKLRAERRAAFEKSKRIIIDCMTLWGASGSYVQFGNQFVEAIEEEMNK